MLEVNYSSFHFRAKAASIVPKNDSNKMTCLNVLLAIISFFIALLKKHF